MTVLDRSNIAPKTHPSNLSGTCTPGSSRLYTAYNPWGLAYNVPDKETFSVETDNPAYFCPLPIQYTACESSSYIRPHIPTPKINYLPLPQQHTYAQMDFRLQQDYGTSLDINIPLTLDIPNSAGVHRCIHLTPELNNHLHRHTPGTNQLPSVTSALTQTKQPRNQSKSKSNRPMRFFLPLVIPSFLRDQEIQFLQRYSRVPRQLYQT